MGWTIPQAPVILANREFCRVTVLKVACASSRQVNCANELRALDILTSTWHWMSCQEWDDTIGFLRHTAEPVQSAEPAHCGIQASEVRSARFFFRKNSSCSCDCDDEVEAHLRAQRRHEIPDARCHGDEQTGCLTEVFEVWSFESCFSFQTPKGVKGLFQCQTVIRDSL